MDLENTSHLEVHKKAFCFDTPYNGFVIKKASTEEEAGKMLLEDFNKGYLKGYDFLNSTLSVQDLLKIVHSVEPYPKLDIVYFEGILTTRVGASTTLKERENELES